MIFSEPALRQLGDVDDVHARVLIGQAVQNPAGLICGAVISDDEFEIRVILREDGLQSLFDFPRFVACRHNHRDLRQVGASQRWDAGQMAQRTVAHGEFNDHRQDGQERHHRQPEEKR